MNAKSEIVPGEYLVKLRTSIAKISHTNLEKTLGVKIKRTIPEGNILVIEKSILEKSDSGHQIGVSRIDIGMEKTWELQTD